MGIEGIRRERMSRNVSMRERGNKDVVGGDTMAIGMKADWFERKKGFRRFC